eukprot:687878-Prymnesium_polylepis.1
MRRRAATRGASACTTCSRRGRASRSPPSPSSWRRAFMHRACFASPATIRGASTCRRAPFARASIRPTFESLGHSPAGRSKAARRPLGAAATRSKGWYEPHRPSETWVASSVSDLVIPIYSNHLQRRYKAEPRLPGTGFGCGTDPYGPTTHTTD